MHGWGLRRQVRRCLRYTRQRTDCGTGDNTIANEQIHEREQMQLADELYERYGKPLEADHWGEFIAIAPDGRYVIGASVREVSRNASKVFGIGPRVIGKWLQAVWRASIPLTNVPSEGHPLSNREASLVVEVS